jgi:hypothetical protein
LKKVTADIWVYIDLRKKKHFEEGINLIGAAKVLAGMTCGKTVALLMDTGDKDILNHIKGISPDDASAISVKNGADSVFIVEHGDLSLQARYPCNGCSRSCKRDGPKDGALSPL